VGNYNPSVLHGHEDTEPYIFRGNDLDFLGSVDVIGHVTIGLGICGFLLVVHCNHASNLHRWWRSIVVRTSVLAGELSVSCARLMDGHLTTL